jgi:hypothetical protein
MTDVIAKVADLVSSVNTDTLEVLIQILSVRKTELQRIERQKLDESIKNMAQGEPMQVRAHNGGASFGPFSTQLQQLFDSPTPSFPTQGLNNGSLGNGGDRFSPNFDGNNNKSAKGKQKKINNQPQHQVPQKKTWSEVTKRKRGGAKKGQKLVFEKAPELTEEIVIDAEKVEEAIEKGWRGVNNFCGNSKCGCCYKFRDSHKDACDDPVRKNPEKIESRQIWVTFGEPLDEQTFFERVQSILTDPKDPTSVIKAYEFVYKGSYAFFTCANHKEASDAAYYLGQEGAQVNFARKETPATDDAADADESSEEVNISSTKQNNVEEDYSDQPVLIL